MTNKLCVYIGTEEDWDDHLFLDLNVLDEEIFVKCSESLNLCSEQDFIDALDEILRLANKLSTALNIPIEIDKAEIMRVVNDEEYSPERRKQAISLLKGVE